MRQTDRAIVIGSGIGGSAATVLLAHAGVPTLLLEKNPRLGGSCSYYEKRGFHIDIGTHLFTRGHRGPLGTVLERVNQKGAIRFVRTRDIAEIRGARWSEGADEPELMQVTLPADVARMPAFVWSLVRALELTPSQAVRAGRLFAHMLTMSEAEVRAWDHHTLQDFLVPFGCDTKTLSLFGLLLGLYFILPYWEVSAGEALYAFRRMIRDNCLSYPIGGAVAIPSTYCRLAERFGAEVRTRAGVRRVVLERGEVVGVELDDGSFEAGSIVISTSSLRTTVKYLVGEQHYPNWYVERALSIRGSYIAVQAKIALKRKLVDAGALVGGVGSLDLNDLTESDMRSTFDRFQRGEIPDVVPFYCPVPTNFDPDLAPDGCQLLTVCSLAPTTDIPLVDAPRAWEDAMMRAVRRVVPGLDDEILFVDRFSVKFIEHWIGKEFGPAVSTGQTPEQVGSQRPPVHTPIAGLYMAGCGAGGRGVGTELAAASAMECVDRILVDLGHEHRPRRRSRVGTLRRATVKAALRPMAWATRARA